MLAHVVKADRHNVSAVSVVDSAIVHLAVGTRNNGSDADGSAVSEIGINLSMRSFELAHVNHLIERVVLVV